MKERWAKNDSKILFLRCWKAGVATNRDGEDSRRSRFARQDQELIFEMPVRHLSSNVRGTLGYKTQSRERPLFCLISPSHCLKSSWVDQ